MNGCGMDAHVWDLMNKMRWDVAVLRRDLLYEKKHKTILDQVDANLRQHLDQMYDMYEKNTGCGGGRSGDMGGGGGSSGNKGAKRGDGGTHPKGNKSGKGSAHDRGKGKGDKSGKGSAHGSGKGKGDRGEGKGKDEGDPMDSDTYRGHFAKSLEMRDYYGRWYADGISWPEIP